MASSARGTSAATQTLILHVDDNEPGRYATVRVLKKAGYDVLEASDGNGALAAVAEHAPDLVLLDVNLPDMTGFEVCQRLKDDPRTTHIPVVHMTASAGNPAHKAHGLLTGADSYLIEPVEPEVLVATVEAALRDAREEARLRADVRAWQCTFDGISDGVAVVDGDGAIVRHNAGLQRVLESEALGRRFAEVFPEAAAIMPEIKRREVDIQRGSGWFHLTCDPLLDDSGRISGGVYVFSDITERRQMQQSIQQTQKYETIAMLAGGVAHDFNNLLTGIMGNASLARTELEPESRVQSMLEDIVRCGERAAELTNQLLAYSGKGRYVVRPLDLSSLVRETASLIQTVVQNKKIAIEFVLGSPLPKVEADAHQMQQLMMSLVNNAAEAIGEESAGSIRIVTGADGGEVWLEVQDSGCGMDEETQAQIFDPFFSTKFLGRGLGLAAVSGIVRGHKGRIAVKSALGKGSTFRVSFPALADQKRSRGTVLLVDDEDVVRRAAKAALEAYGYDVLIASDGREGVELYRRNSARLALVVLDLIMPAMNGDDALQEMYEIDPAVPVIITSGFSVDLAARRFIGRKVAGYLQKPFTAQRLVGAVEVALK